MGATLFDGRLRLAVEPFEHSFDHASVNRAQDVRVTTRGLAERTVFRDQRQRVPAGFGVKLKRRRSWP